MPTAMATPQAFEPPVDTVPAPEPEVSPTPTMSPTRTVAAPASPTPPDAEATPTQTTIPETPSPTPTPPPTPTLAPTGSLEGSFEVTCTLSGEVAQLDVAFTATATGALRIGRVRVLVDGQEVFDEAAGESEAQSMARSLEVKTTSGLHTIEVRVEAEGGIEPVVIIGSINCGGS